MVQVKSGKGNVHESTSAFTYYMTNIHYEYFMRVQMPVVLVLYSPEERCAWWNSINNSTVQPTSSEWKLDLPKHQMLNAESRSALSRLLDDFPKSRAILQHGTTKIRSESELLSDVTKLSTVSTHISAVSASQLEFNKGIRRVTQDLRRYTSLGLLESSKEIQGSLTRANALFTRLSTSLDANIKYYTESFTTSCSALEVLIQIREYDNYLLPEYPSLLASIKVLRSSLDTTIPEVETFLSTTEELPNFVKISRGRAQVIRAIDNMAKELRDSRSLVTRLILLVESRMSK